MNNVPNQTDNENAFADNDQAESQKLHIYKTRYCTTCLIYRPPLASHCKYCDHCVKNFDHHCEFINNCIGPRNKKQFLILSNFLVLSTSFYIYIYKMYQDAVIDKLNIDE